MRKIKPVLHHLSKEVGLRVTAPPAAQCHELYRSTAVILLISEVLDLSAIFFIGFQIYKMTSTWNCTNLLVSG